MQEKWEKFAYIKNFYYLCSRFLEGVLRTPNIERFLQLDYSDVGWRIHSAPIEHPFSIHWEKVETTWKGGSAHLPRIQSLETDEGGRRIETVSRNSGIAEYRQEKSAKIERIQNTIKNARTHARSLL